MHQKLLQVIALLMVVMTYADAQKPDPPDPLLTNEYRFTQIYTKPINEKWVMFAYTGYTQSPEKKYASVYASPPNLIYIPKSWLELYAAFIAVYTHNYRSTESWEFRPVVAAKLYVPNNKKIFLYSWTRFEDRFILQDHNLQSIPRLRNRFGVEAPIATKAKKWAPKTFYWLADIEPIWRLDQKKLEILRFRGGVGYIFKPRLRAEFQYFGDLSPTNNAPLGYVNSIWRLNLKFSFPRHGWRYPGDADID